MIKNIKKHLKKMLRSSVSPTHQDLSNDTTFSQIKSRVPVPSTDLTLQGSIFDAVVAMDQVEFFNCGVPLPQETCEETQFHCVISKACVYQVSVWSPIQVYFLPLKFPFFQNILLQKFFVIFCNPGKVQ